MKTKCLWLPALLAALLVSACDSAKGPAERALGSAESTFASLQELGQKYAPEQLGAVEMQLQTMKDSYARNDYKAVVDAAPAMSAALTKLKDTATAKKEEVAAALAQAKADWGPLSTEMPKTLAAIQSRLDVLGTSHHLPKGVTRDGLAAAHTALESMKSTWGEATAAADSGDFTGAMAKAQAVRDQATRIMQSLGMSAG